MKKTGLFLLLVFTAIGSAISQESSEKIWTNNLGVGLSVPISYYNTDATNVNQAGISISANYIGIHKNGFSAKGVIETGGVGTDDISFPNKDGVQAGPFVRVDIGPGWTFYRGEKLTLGAFAMFGVEAAIYQTPKEEHNLSGMGKTDRNYGQNIYSFTMGADLTAIWNIKPHFNFFANIGARFIPFGVTENNVIYLKDDYKRIDTNADAFFGGFSVTPTIGLIWNW